MNFLELAKSRFSSRDYLNIPIENEKLLRVLEAGRVAPSAVNRQPWHFVVITKKERLKELSVVYHREWFNNAPVYIFMCGDVDKAWVRSADNKNHLDIDIAIATDHITLQASEIGLATCWICDFDVKQTKKLLNLPKNIEPIVVLTLAYPADKTDIKRHNWKRKNIKEIIHWENF